MIPYFPFSNSRILMFSFALILISSNFLLSQETGSFTETIQSNSEDWEIAVFVSEAFEPTNELSLLIGLHGCGQNGSGYRDQLSLLADANNMIIVCPEIPSISAQLGKMLENDRKHIINSIVDWAKNTYLVNPNNVYLTGFSCNGGMTFFHGLNEVYDFKGIIPFNSYLAPAYNGQWTMESGIKNSYLYLFGY